MPRFHVQRSIEIEAPLESIRPLIHDFPTWPKWSPWLVAEPDTQLDFAPDGSSYAWDGRFTGRGRITIDHELPDRLGYSLLFLKPYRSTSRTGFEFKETNGTTVVTWSMDGSLPFFLFFMKKPMCAWIGSDYERGLLMLKDLAEKGEVPSRLEFPGIEPVSAIPYVGIRGSCPTAEIAPHMERGFGRLGDWLSANSLVPSGPMFSIYHKWDMVHGRAEYTCAVPLDAAPAPLPDGFHGETVPGGKAYVILHTGAYRHLGNGWAAGMMRARAREFRCPRGEAPMEIYRNDPGDTPENGLVTEIRMPAV